MAPRKLAVEAGVGAAFLVGAVLLAALADDGTAMRWDVAVPLVVGFAIALRAQFDAGTGYVPPTQLIFVPVLFLEPAKAAPLIALAGWLLGRLPDIVTGRMHPTRLLNVPGNCWFAIGPAAILTAAGSHAPDWSEVPVYLAALAAQFGGDAASSFARAGLAEGVAAVEQLRAMAYVWVIDAALSPIGLLAAFASERSRFAFLAVLPLAGLLVLFSRERTRRFDAERATVRAREAMIAGASHELQTPLAVLSGLTDSLVRRPELSVDRRALTYRTMQRQTEHLRHLVGQFVDYASLKAGQRLTASPRPTDVQPLLDDVAATWRAQTRVEVGRTAAVAFVDPGRLHSVLMSLVSNAVKHGPAEGPVTMSARLAGEVVVVEIEDRGPGLPARELEAVFAEFDGREGRREGPGVGLFLARAVLRAQGADLRLRNRAEGGLVAVVELPAAALTPGDDVGTAAGADTAAV